MKRTITILLTLSLASLASAQRPLRHVLFDFEDGIEAWTTYVWGGGGTVTLSPAAEPKFGTGALRSEIAEVERGGNTIAPHFDEPDAWREYEWGQISLPAATAPRRGRASACSRRRRRGWAGPLAHC